MTLKWKFSLLTFFLIITFTNGQSTDAVENTQTELTNSINEFSNRFYSELIKFHPGKDVIMSALSAQMAFTLLSLGARGETLNQLNDAFILPNSTFAKSAFQSAIVRYNSLKGIILNIANKIYVDEKIRLNPTVQKEAVDWFFSEIENLDFQNGNSTKIMNEWVSLKTNDKIKDILTEEMVKQMIMIIINAIYFKGKWDKQFDPKVTGKKDFSISLDKKAQVDMMTQTLWCPYLNLENLDAKAIELFYQGKNASMVIILPNKIDGLNNLEMNIKKIDIKKEIFHPLEQSYDEVAVSIPKFKIGTKTNLNEAIQNLGAKLIFDGGDLQSFLLINNFMTLSVGLVIQEAFIEVNEEGTEAAAVTGMAGITSVRQIQIFNADHPFMFFIKTSTGEILFSGRFIGSELSNKTIISTTEAPLENVNNNWRPWRRFPCSRYIRRYPKK